MKSLLIMIATAPLLAGCATALPTGGTVPPITAAADEQVVPLVDHHAHIVSAQAARGSYPLPLDEVILPRPLADVLAARQRAWNDPSALAPLYLEQAVVLNTGNEDLPSWIGGRAAAAEYVGTLFGRPHRIKPVEYSIDGDRAFIAGYFYRPEIDRHFGHVLLSLARGRDGRWRIAAEAPTFPGPPGAAEFDAETLVKQLDEAGIRRAVVLSVAYWFGSAFRSVPQADEYGLVRAENDWVADQVAPFADRLISFCSVNPLKDYAIAEVRRCAAQNRHRGLKLHFGNSEVDLRQPEQSRAVAAVFAEANRHKLPLIAHMWTAPDYEAEGGAHVQAFLDGVLPSAPDVTVQIAHMAGGGRVTQPAMKVFADAFAAGDPRTRNLYFDVATLTGGETPQNLRLDAEHMRKIGLERFLFGSDTSQTARVTWQLWPALHALPLTQSEFRQLARNVAPYVAGE
ncbi:MAG: amidohydrolase family protein [Pseudomonadota bacterium]|nr:amidohydrolase family protein [Pseudomonadota bacterium]